MRYGKIHTSAPINLSEETAKYFLPIKSYRARIPKIKHLRNVFVSHQGLVLRNGLLEDGCAFNLIGKEDNTFYLPMWKHTLEQYLVCRFGKSLPSVKLKHPDHFLLIHSKWFNYSFWVTDCLVRLILAEEAGILKSTKLIFPEGWDNIQYINQSLEVFNLKREVIPADHHMFIDNLVMPETRQWTAAFYPYHIKKVHDRYVAEAMNRTSLKEFPKRIYLTRKSRGMRCVENEIDVMRELTNYGFSSLAFEDLSFWDQIALMYKSEAFISIHGAGFSNVLFMRPGSIVMELINKPYADAEYTFPFWRLSSAANLKYFFQLCNVVNSQNTELQKGLFSADPASLLVNQNIVVNISELRENLRNIFKQ